MNRRERIQDGLTLVVAMCGIVATGLLIRREFFVPKVVLAESEKPVRIKDWEAVARVGHRLGGANATVTIVEFGDYQCPGCQKFATRVWPAIQKQFGDSVALVYRHFPLSYHKAAYPAARGAECASHQDKFEAFHNRLFAQQDSLKEKTLVAFARESGVSDLPRFAACVADSLPVASIEADMRAFELIGGHATPTIAIAGWRFQVPPDSSRLAQFIAAELRKHAGSR